MRNFRFCSPVRRSIVTIMMFLVTGACFVTSAQSPQANLDQANNGRDNAPNNPMDWVNGNLN